MKYSQATNYALHTMLYFVALPSGTTLGVQQLAAWQSLSPTYLSKILTKLVKAGLIASAPGMNGGYRLLKERDALSFLDVIHAIEGTASLFHCGTGAQHTACRVQQVMSAAEHELEAYLKDQKLAAHATEVASWLVQRGFTPEA